MVELKASVLKTIKKRNIELLDFEEGILRCNRCGKAWTIKKTWVNTAAEKGVARPEYMVDWEGRLPAGWWKCPEGCWRL